MGYTNNIYNKVEFIHPSCPYSAILEMKYAFFFAPKWGVSLGAGVSRYAAQGTLNISGFILEHNDPLYGNGTYNLHYKTNNLVEKQRILALEAPLQFHFEHRVGRNGLFASLGATGYFPIILAQSKYPQGRGSITTSGYDAHKNVMYEDLPMRFGTGDARVTPAKANMNISVDAVAEFGGIFRISESCDFYLGVYGSYGFLDILPTEKRNFITSEPNSTFTINSLLASNYLSEYNNYIEQNNLGWKKAAEKWNRWQAGAKIGFHIKPMCKKEKKGKSMREARRDYYNYMSSGENNNSRSEIHTIYVYNIAPSNYLNDNDFTEKERETISNLVNALSNGKILFDIDSDVPKIEDKNFIVAASDILKMEPSLNLIIEGYTCDLGSEQHNRELAKKRAETIRDLFVKQGVSPSQITVAGYIASDPQSKINIKNEEREEHRAVIFRIVKGKIN